MARYSLTFIANSENFSALVYETHNLNVEFYMLRDSLFAFLSSTSSRSIKTQKGELGQYPAILTELAWLIKDFYMAIGALKNMTFVPVY